MERLQLHELPVRPSRTLAPAERVQIYADMYFARIRDAVAEDFPAVVACIGDERWTELMRDYLQDHPPTHYSLRFAGEHLPDFLHTHALATTWPFLSELAQFEWMLVDLFDAPDSDMLTHDQLATIPQDDWASLHLRTIPAWRCAEFRWPVDDIRTSLLESDDLALGLPEPITLAVWRKNFDCVFRRVTAQERALLDRLFLGCDFASLCDAIIADATIDPAHPPTQAVGRYLEQWLTDGCLRVDATCHCEERSDKAIS